MGCGGMGDLGDLHIEQSPRHSNQYFQKNVHSRTECGEMATSGESADSKTNTTPPLLQNTSRNDKKRFPKDIECISTNDNASHVLTLQRCKCLCTSRAIFQGTRLSSKISESSECSCNNITLPCLHGWGEDNGDISLYSSSLSS